MSGIKHDQGKPRISLIPARAIIEEAKVFTEGAKKYADHNWALGLKYSRLIDAALRHILAFSAGENNDPEFDLSHLAHARCCLAMLMEMGRLHQELDDRRVEGTTLAGERQGANWAAPKQESLAEGLARLQAKPRLVIIESPYAGDIERNQIYLRRCLAHSLSLGEAPFASHAIYTQPEVLDDGKASERKRGIEAGFAWWSAAELVVFYTDYGMSGGMHAANARAFEQGRKTETRMIGPNP